MHNKVKQEYLRPQVVILPHKIQKKSYGYTSSFAASSNKLQKLHEEILLIFEKKVLWTQHVLFLEDEFNN